jgi:hypothetical protein
MNTFKGPLGSHRNYIKHIALQNYDDYQALCELNKENGKRNTPDKYKEFRLFLNVIESMNNILDYLYFEHEDEVQQSNLKDFKRAVWNKHPELEALADLANAYKHCVREWRGVKNSPLHWAKDLQNPQLKVNVTISPSEGFNASVNYEFLWPIVEHEQSLEKALKFWLSYVQHDGCDLRNV